MGEPNTFTEGELRRRLWATGDGADPERLTALADDALRQARRGQRILRTATTLSVALVVSVTGLTASSVIGHVQRPSSGPTGAATGSHGPVRLAAPLRVLPVLSSTAQPCKTGTLRGADTLCYSVDPARGLTFTEVASVKVTQTLHVPAGRNWEVDLTFPSGDKAPYARLTASAYNRQLAFIVDGVVESAPIFQGTITTGRPPSPV